MIWKHLWLIPAQKQFYWKFTFYIKGYFFPWSEFWVYRENFLPLLGSAGKSRPVTVILSSVTHVSLIFHLRGNSGYQTLCSAFRVYFIIELVAVRSATLLKNFLDCCMSVFTQPKKFPWRNHPKKSGDGEKQESSGEAYCVIFLVPFSVWIHVSLQLCYMTCTK